jgi:hypothetical protein
VRRRAGRASRPAASPPEMLRPAPALSVAQRASISASGVVHERSGRARALDRVDRAVGNGRSSARRACAPAHLSEPVSHSARVR